MRKSLLVVLSLVLIFSMVLTSCGPKEEEPMVEEAVMEEKGPVTLDVWSFTNEIMTMAVAYEKDHPNVDVVYSMVPMTDGEYQTKIKAALNTSDVPDVIALEAAFVKDYVESDFLADLSDLAGAVEAAETYPSVVEVGTDGGVLKALSYQATPGAFFYRRSMAKEYLGTDDPAEVQAMISDFEGFTAVAAKIKEGSDGNAFMVANTGEFMNPFYTNREQPWVVDGELVIDPMVEEYVSMAKMFHDEGYEAQAGQWSEGWFAAMRDELVDAEGESKSVFGYFLPTWGLTYVVFPQAKDTATSGDWGIVAGPLPYQWGGTWLGAMKDSDNLDTAKDFIAFVVSEENLTNWATGVYTNEYLAAIDPEVPSEQFQGPGDFVSSAKVVADITASFDDSEMSAFLGGQNSYSGFAAAAPSVSGALMQGSDDAIQRSLADPINLYVNGEIELDEMWAAFKDAVEIEFPDLIIE